MDSARSSVRAEEGWSERAKERRSKRGPLGAPARRCARARLAHEQNAPPHARTRAHPRVRLLTHCSPIHTHVHPPTHPHAAPPTPHPHPLKGLGVYSPRAAAHALAAPHPARTQAPTQPHAHASPPRCGRSGGRPPPAEDPAGPTGGRAPGQPGWTSMAQRMIRAAAVPNDSSVFPDR